LGEYRLAQTQYYVAKGVQSGVKGGVGGTPTEGNTEKGPGVIRVSGAVAQGILLKRVDPVYPAVARAAHVTGSVVLHAIISKEGKVVEVTAVSGPDPLRSAAVAAVSQWVYKPYLLNGTPTGVDTLVIVNFDFDRTTNPPSSTTPAEPQ
jgi:protein TonB